MCIRDRFSTDAPQAGRAKIRKRVLFSYACYESFFLTGYYNAMLYMPKKSMNR